MYVCTMETEVYYLYVFVLLIQNEEVLADGRKKTSFELSVKMSTYLVCFAVHQFKAVERTANSGIPVSMACADTPDTLIDSMSVNERESIGSSLHRYLP